MLFLLYNNKWKVIYLNFVKRQFKEGFLYFSENVKNIFLMCLTGFILLAVVMHFVFLAQPEATKTVYENISGMIDNLNIPIEGWGCFRGIFFNNIKAMFFCIIYGFIPFLFLPVFILCTNIMSVSAVLAYSIIAGNTKKFVFFTVLYGIVPHGIFEIPAICLAVALGINLCIKLNKKIIGNEEVKFSDTVKNTFRIAIIAVIPLTFSAALVEAFLTPLLLNKAYALNSLSGILYIMAISA